MHGFGVRKIWILGGLCIYLYGALVFGQSNSESKSFFSKLEVFPKVHAFQVGDISYSYFPELIAFKSLESEPSEKVKSLAVATLGQIAVIKDNGSSSVNGSQYRILQDSKAGSLAFMSGTVKVKLSSDGDAAFIEAKHSLRLVSKVKEIGLYYFKPLKIRRIDEYRKILDNLMLENAVESAEPVVLTQFNNSL